jgi:hypothetical protein
LACAIPSLVRLSQRGAASRSFVIAIAAVVAAGVGYTGWSLLWADPYALSERTVRDSRREVASVMRDLEREVDTILRAAQSRGKAVGPEMDERAAAALQAIDEIVDRAGERLGRLDIDIRTQHNRMDRIAGRTGEAKAMVKQLIDEAKQKAGQS